jgi:hypothetical protein
LWLAY